MKPKWSYSIYALIVAMALIIGFARLHSQSPTSPTVPWKTAHPLLSPKGKALTIGASYSARIHPITLPQNQLQSAEWFLPLSARSSLSYILHDGKARWVVNGLVRNLNHVPTDPVNLVAHTTNGLTLAWVNPGGGVTLMTGPSGKSHQISHASALGFTAKNQIVTLQNHPSPRVAVNQKPLAWTIAGTPAQYHPFIGDTSEIAVDRNGELLLQSIRSGATATIARVRPTRWPILYTARAIKGGSALLLERPSVLTDYLLIVDIHHQVAWYRFQSPTIPELGTVGQTLVVENLLLNGTLALIPGGQIHPLNVTPGIFSQASHGIIWQGRTSFQEMTGWSS